jgi:hypothetical protein
MLNRLRPRVTYANVVSSLCLFILLGGVAYAASLPKNSVGTKQLKPDAVKSGKVKNGTLKREDAKAGQFVVPSQLSGIDAAKLGGIAAAGFLQGNGKAISAQFDVTSETGVLGIPGGGQILVECNGSGSAVLFDAVTNTWDVYTFSYVNTVAKPNVFHATRTPGGLQIFSSSKQVSVYQFDARSSAGASAAVTVFVHFDDATDHCIGRVRGLSFG